MPKKVIENQEIEDLSKDLLIKTNPLFGEESLSLRELEPFVKIFLQLESEYKGNENTFAAKPNNNFLAFIVFAVLRSENQPSEELLRQLSPFVSASPLSDFFFFHQEDLSKEEARVIFLRQQVFPEMLEDFDHQVTMRRVEKKEEDTEFVAPSPSSDSGPVVAMTPDGDLPDDMLEEDLPELRQGLVKVKPD